MLPVCKIAFEQQLRHLGPLAVMRAKVRQPVRIERIRQHDSVKLKIQPGFRRRAADIMVHLDRFVARHAVLRRQHLMHVMRIILLRIRVQLEAPILDVDMIPVLELGNCFLQTAFADIAERAGKVRPYFDLHG
ncbi:hypothetical protein D3C84_763210 [compost metagenome]